MTQARHEISTRRGQESYDAGTVDSVSSFFAASKDERESGLVMRDALASDA